MASALSINEWLVQLDKPFVDGEGATDRELECWHMKLSELFSSTAMSP